MVVSRQDQDRIAHAIHEAESATSGEIICVLAGSSGNYDVLPALWAAAAALALPWLLMLATQWTVLRILLLQVVVFAALWLLLSLPLFAMRLAPRRAQRANAHRAAMEQFVIRHLSRTKTRSGVLIFVSLAERYARIVADDGMAEKIPQGEWQAIVDALVAHMRKGEVADGFVGAVKACGAALQKHFPADGAKANELPDKLYVI